MSLSPVDYLRHIYDECTFLQTKYNENTFESFNNDRVLMYAVCRSLEIIGEATKNVSDELRIKYPLVEWKKMAGIRDKIIHDYLGVDYEVVWKTIEDKIPSLQEWMEIIIEKESN